MRGERAVRKDAALPTTNATVVKLRSDEGEVSVGDSGSKSRGGGVSKCQDTA